MSGEVRQRILVVFATREGQTEKVATRIASHIEARGHGVSVVNARDDKAVRDLRLGAYELLVFGGSMHAGGIEDELVRFINGHEGEIVTKRRFFFLVLLSAATRDPSLRAQWLQDARAKMNSQLKVAFEHVEMIAGALRYSKYPTPLKWLMRRIASQAGEGTDTSKDYEYTDWEQVAAFADRLVDELANDPTNSAAR